MNVKSKNAKSVSQISNSLYNVHFKGELVFAYLFTHIVISTLSVYTLG